MAHDVHFLERLSRVKMHQADLALALYRDPQRVQWLLWQLKLPDEVERVALALSNEPDGPHVVVARDGGFVTCLGAGMSVTNLTRITREQMAAHDAGLAAFREAGDRIARHDGGAEELLGRIWKRNQRLSREDFCTIEAWLPVLEEELWPTFYEAAVNVRDIETAFRRRRYRQMDKKHARGLQAYWNLTWALGHLTLLLGRRMDWLDELMARRGGPTPHEYGTFTWPAARTAVLGLVLRAAWSAARVADRARQDWLEALREPVLTEARCLHAAVGLCAASLLDPALRDETLAAFDARVPRDGAIPDWVEDDVWTLKLVNRLRFVLIQTEAAEQLGRRVAALIMSNDGDPALLERYGVGVVMMCPDTLLFAEDTLNFVMLLPLIVGRPAAELYPTEAHLAEWRPIFTVDDIATHLGKQQDYLGRYTPTRVEARPGRNEPCSCGSGRKYKHCCGGRN